MMTTELTPEEMQSLLTETPDWQIIDVREAPEFAQCHISGAVNVPLGDLHTRFATIDNAKPALLVSGDGSRAESATLCLAQHGNLNTKILKGGMKAWLKAKSPVERGRAQPWDLERQALRRPN